MTTTLTRSTRFPVHTPWGPSQHEYEKAPGIVFFSTAGHGGYRLSEDREAARQRRFSVFQTYAGGPWYEEDQDCVVVVLTFPDLYEADELRAAVRIARSSALPFEYEERGVRKVREYPRWQEVVQWIDGDDRDAVSIRERVAEWEQANADKWEVGSMSTCGRGWSVMLTRVRDRARQTVTMEYPEQRFYSDEELHVLRLDRRGAAAVAV